MIFPITYDIKMKPQINPPVGPRMTPGPPLMPANTGSPAMPMSMYTTWLNTPRLLPSNAPDNRTAIVCPVIGTGVKGRGIITRLITMVRAVKRDILVISFRVIQDYPFFWLMGRLYHKINGVVNHV